MTNLYTLGNLQFDQDPFIQHLVFPKRVSNELFILIASMLAVQGPYIKAYRAQLNSVPKVIKRKIKLGKSDKIIWKNFFD